MSKLKDLISEIKQNPEEGYVKLNDFFAKKPDRSDTRLNKGLLQLSSREKTRFLTEFARHLKACNIHEVDLCDNELTAEHLATFVENLQNKSIRVIKANNNLLQNRGMLRLSKALVDKGVETLELNNSQIGDQGLIDLGQHLDKSKVECIRLEQNAFSSNALKEFTKKCIRVKILLLKQNHINECDATEIGNNLKNTALMQFSIANCGLSTRAAIDIITELKQSQVFTINMSNNPIGDKFAKELGLSLNGSSISSLNLYNSRLSKTGIFDLISNTTHSNLKRLDVANSRSRSMNDYELADVLRYKPITNLRIDHGSKFVDRNRELIDSILRQNESNNRLTKMYMSCRKSIKHLNFPLAKLGFAGSAFGVGFALLIGAASTMALVLSTVASAFVFMAGYSSTAIAMKMRRITDKKRYKAEFEYEREQALILSRRLSSDRDKELIDSYAKLFDEATEPQFDNNGGYIQAPQNTDKLFVLRRQVSQLKGQPEENNGYIESLRRSWAKI